MTTAKTKALTIWTFVSKVMSLLCHTMSRFVIAFLPRSNHLIISWLYSSPAVILAPKTPNIEAPKYIKILKDLKGEVDGNTIIVWNFNTLLTSMDRSLRQKINKVTEILNDKIEQLYLIYISRIFH